MIILRNNILDLKKKTHTKNKPPPKKKKKKKNQEGQDGPDLLT